MEAYEILSNPVDDGTRKAAYPGAITAPNIAHTGKEYATVQDVTTESFTFPSGSLAGHDPLTDVLRRGARNLLIQAVEAEAAAWIAGHSHLTDRQGHRQVVRNGHAEPRTVVTGVGPLQVTMPRVHDRRTEDERERFTSKILPPYLRKAKSIDELIPWLYLKGISTGGFSEALTALLGPDCPGLSPTTVTRLVATWQDEHSDWSKRDLSDKQYVYIWADGIHFNVRLEEDRQCILVVMGATAEGVKELIAVQDGYRESEQSWSSLLLDLKHRGLSIDPKVATADGALGFWAAARKVFPGLREQRCWVHKTANILDKLPKRLQVQAKELLHQIWMAPTRQQAETAFDLFIATYEAKYPAAVECLRQDRDVLLTFYDFPAEHWIHLRTTNPIESTFATVRLRHRKTKGNGSRRACLAMVFKLCQSAQSRWRRLNSHALIQDVIAGVTFTDGEKTKAA
jgi:transposase-like protein